MTITINNFLKLTLDLSENNVNSEEYILLNDLSYNNVLNIYFFFNTLIINQNVTITINQYDVSNTLQTTDTCILNYDNKNLIKNIILTTVNTKINISYSYPLNATLIGVFEKKINDELIINTLNKNPNDVFLNEIHSINSNSIIPLRVQDGTQFELVNVNQSNFDIINEKVNIANNITKINNPSLFLNNNTVDVNGSKLNNDSNAKIIINNPKLQINDTNLDITFQNLYFDNQNININNNKIDINGNKLNINDENINITNQKINIIDNNINIINNKVDISGERVDISGERFNISSENFDVSGRRLDISGERFDISAIRLDISGERLDISGERFDISGRRLDISGERFDISGERFDISGRRLDISGERLDISGEKFDISGRRLDISSERFDISGEIVNFSNNIIKKNLISNQILQFYLCGERYGSYSRLITFPLDEQTVNTIILPSSPQQFVIVSSSALNDYSISSGLTQVLIYAVDGSYNLVTEVVNLNGTNNVNTSGLYYCVNKMEAYTGNLQNDSYVTCKGNGSNGSSTSVYSALGIAQLTDVVPTTSPYHAAFNYQPLVMCPANYKMCLKSITMENISISGSNYILSGNTGQFSILKYSKNQIAGPTAFIWFKFYSSYIKPYKTNVYTFNTGEVVCMTDATSTIGCFAYLHFDFIPL